MRSRACCCFSHRAALITGSVLLAPVLMLAGCQGLPANVANCSVTPTPPQHLGCSAGDRTAAGCAVRLRR